MNTQQTTMLDEPEASGSPVPVELHLLVMSPDSFISLPLPVDELLVVGRSSNCRIRLEDPLSSREHARLQVRATDAGLRLEIEDLDSANGTRVRDESIAPRRWVPFLVGEAITIGSTVLMAQKSRPAVGLRRLWSHAYFEGRLEDECARAGADASFALARVHLTEKVPWPKVVPILVRNIAAPHLFAAYGPRDYEILFLQMPPAEVIKQMEALSRDLRESAIHARHGVAWYPRDGRTADALLARANALVKHVVAAGPRTAPAGDGDGGGGGPVAAIAEAEVPMERLRELAKRVSSMNITVLILGETGVGKDVLARTIHKLSGRKGEFVALNCAGLAPTLIESELFGYEKGAFSGAATARIGLLEAANAGTVFLDEIGEMPLTLQSKLLRALEAHEILPVGGVKARPIDVRFLAATNRDLEAWAHSGAFRQDLFFRLNRFVLTVPALRFRTDEIPTLAEAFITASCLEWGRVIRPTLDPKALEVLLRYAWPGNIRELKNAIERALVLCDGARILPEHLPLDKMRLPPLSRATGDERSTTGRQLAVRGAVDAGKPSTRSLDDGGGVAEGLLSESRAEGPWVQDRDKTAERERILAALNANAWSQTRAAKSLGMPRRTFVSKLEYYRIPRPQKGLPPAAA